MRWDIVSGMCWDVIGSHRRRWEFRLVPEFGRVAGLIERGCTLGGAVCGCGACMLSCVSVSVQDGWTPLLSALKMGRDAVVGMLIEAGADVNMSDPVRLH